MMDKAVITIAYSNRLTQCINMIFFENFADLIEFCIKCTVLRNVMYSMNIKYAFFPTKSYLYLPNQGWLYSFTLMF